MTTTKPTIQSLGITVDLIAAYASAKSKHAEESFSEITATERAFRRFTIYFHELA